MIKNGLARHCVSYDFYCLLFVFGLILKLLVYSYVCERVRISLLLG